MAHQFRAEEIISLQVLGGIIGFLLGAWLVGSGTVGGGTGILVLVLLPLLGVYAPKSWLDRKVQERKDSIRRDLPDTLDLLAISVEAGMGFEGALGVVCDNFSSPLADEFARYASRDGAGPPPQGGPAEPAEAHGGARAIELRADPDPSRRPGDAGGPGAEDLGRRRCARSASSGRGRRRRSSR